MTQPSDTVQQLIGYATPPQPLPQPATLRAITVSCREGVLFPALARFIGVQREVFFTETLVIDHVDNSRVTGRISGKTEDHESNSPYSVEANFELDLASGKFCRL